MGTMQQEVVLDAAEVAARQDADGVDEGGGVTRTTLWHHSGGTAGTLHLAAGAALDEHTHHAHGHHVWVVSGTAEVLGRELTAGSYWFVPAGLAHALQAAADEPCELFWVYEPVLG